ncbi:gibberellin 20 oxidase 1-B-like [Zingiber officinale]|uniref:gibberellin 20 oxidase 1-B-like n=1 Tax=Zingiber officinale TaxID=94328 RepID=UPI001C4CA7EF|nr:gibberellin 20 oxidase 1-B-like [Zingiber officinale]
MRTSPSPVVACTSTPLAFGSRPGFPRLSYWPRSDRQVAIEELDAPVVDLHGFLHGDKASMRRAAELVQLACERHNFFQVTNQGVAEQRVRDAMDCTDAFFKLGGKRRHRLISWFSNLLFEGYSSVMPWTAPTPSSSSEGREGIGFISCSSKGITNYLNQTRLSLIAN